MDRQNCETGDICLKCRGFGKIPKRVMTHKTVGLGMNQRVFFEWEDVYEDCEICNGKGYRDWIDHVKRPVLES